MLWIFFGVSLACWFPLLVGLMYVVSMLVSIGKNSLIRRQTKIKIIAILGKMTLLTEGLIVAHVSFDQ